jgi:uncharacterized membrane protein YraQ (UPF0718 family)
LYELIHTVAIVLIVGAHIGGNMQQVQHVKAKQGCYMMLVLGMITRKTITSLVTATLVTTIFSFPFQSHEYNDNANNKHCKNMQQKKKKTQKYITRKSVFNKNIIAFWPSSNSEE